MPKLKVIGYEKVWRAHKCTGDDLPCQFIDLMVDGSLPEGLTPDDLIGKTIECKYVHAFIGIAHKCKIIKEE